MERRPMSATVKTPAENETPAGDATTWLEPVTDQQYAAANATA